MSRRQLRWRRRPSDCLDDASSAAGATANENVDWISAARRSSVIPPDAKLLALMSNGALHIRGLFTDAVLLRSLYDEVRAAPLMPWSAHQIHEPRGPAVCAIVDELVRRFDIAQLVETRVNVYEAGDWKPRHQDRNAHCKDAGDYTCGASFFSARELAFSPVDSNEKEGEELFVFLQKSGDAFGFSDDVNRAFYHSVPRSSTTSNTGFRVSVIVWGWRRKGSASS